MAIDNESFDLLLATVQRFVRERLIPAENAVAGEQQEQRISAHRGAHGSACGGCADS